jgi:outer membrane phospholipase A
MSVLLLSGLHGRWTPDELQDFVKPRKSLMRLLVLFWLLMTSTTAFAGNLETVIAPPAEPPRTGQVTEFSVYVHNVGDEIAAVHLPARVSCRISSADQTVEVVATAVPPIFETPTLLERSGFVKGRYAFTVPVDLQGTVRLKVAEMNAPVVMFAIAAGEPPKKEVPDVGSSEPPEGYATVEAFSSLYQPYLVNITSYKPTYFLVGAEPEESKFQISLKYRLFNPEGTLAENHPWLQGLHFGYTQTSFWDLASDSAPFEDTSYKPELFFLSSNINARPSWMKGFFLQTGFQHESNGRGGDFSRSTNFLYARPLFILYDSKTRLGLMVAPKIWAYVNNRDETNPDLENYRGYFDLETKLGKADSFVLGSHLWWADEGVSVQLDLTYPMHRLLFHSLGVYFHAQYVNAVAESLLDYRERTEALRLGFAIVR